MYSKLIVKRHDNEWSPLTIWNGCKVVILLLRYICSHIVVLHVQVLACSMMMYE